MRAAVATLVLVLAGPALAQDVALDERIQAIHKALSAGDTPDVVQRE